MSCGIQEIDGACWQSTGRRGKGIRRQMKRIGDILTRNKTAVTVEDGVTYKQVTIRTNYKGVVLRGTKEGSTIGTKNQFSVSGGQFILSRIDARNGAFGIIPDELEGAIITNDFLAFDINEDEVEREFFNVFLQSPVFLEACIKASRGNTNRKRVNENFFLDYKVNLPPIAEQHQLIKKINTARAHLATAQKEIAHQEALLGKLKQAILQEAIQGKLTENWRAAHPDTEPAAELLKRIQEKQQEWIRQEKANDNKEAKTLERKLNKLSRAPIPPPQEEIPDKWEWVTLLQSNLIIVDCHNKTAPYSPSGIPIIRTTNVRNGKLDLDNTKFITEETYIRWSARCPPTPGDLIFTREAPVGEVGQIPENARVCLGQRTMLIRPIPKLVRPDYLLFVIQSPGFIGRAAEAKHGAMVGHLRVSSVENAMIPLPPLAEQAAIVKRQEALMETVRALESEIKQLRTHTAHLLQAVLKEAFTS
jgi:type I restriction enzyme S subunit